FLNSVSFDSSMHNYLLRYYLAEGRLHPDRDVPIRVVPPPGAVAGQTGERAARGIGRLRSCRPDAALVPFARHMRFLPAGLRGALPYRKQRVPLAEGAILMIDVIVVGFGFSAVPLIRELDATRTGFTIISAEDNSVWDNLNKSGRLDFDLVS